VIVIRRDGATSVEASQLYHPQVKTSHISREMSSRELLMTHAPGSAATARGRTGDGHRWCTGYRRAINCRFSIGAMKLRAAQVDAGRVKRPLSQGVGPAGG